MRENEREGAARKKILVVEDDAHTNELITSSLKMSGFEVMSVFDGKEGIEYAQKYLPDLIVLDLLLPKVDGWEVCRVLRQEGSSTRKIPIVIASVASRFDVGAVDTLMGSLTFLNKPFEPSELISEVKRILDKVI